MSGSILKRVVDTHPQRRGPKVALFVRLPVEVHGAIERIADENGLSMNALVIGMLRAVIEEDRATRARS